ncbi:sensor histidine kinase [Agromyces atrinae]|uniref:histidine kinase n=1 Tax=Agromyces atrinae TaxID=592376 RepID=A0A4Q2M4Z8_9MICO|nr:histidine kinase [Agromyces atrinae]NYD66498.1 signal transduction histidine kinase [Agromyces atrinae]RXZ87175.1 two-component sensor histidine kinase [Agromyces atrinae]
MRSGSLTPDGRPTVGGELRLPKPPGVIRQFWARHPRFTDGLIAGLYGVPSLIGIIANASTAESASTPGSGYAVALAVIATLAVTAVLALARRSRPWLLMSAAWVVCLAVAPSAPVDLVAVVIALYGLGVYRSTRSAWIGFGASVVVGWVATALTVGLYRVDDVEPFGATAPASASQFAIFMLIATLIGITVGNRRRYLDALIGRAHDLAHERDQQAKLATAAERSRIAREMHDIVSHNLTVMVTLAEGAASTTERDAERAASAMRHVAETGRDALGEMRRMLGVLSSADEDSSARSPQPGAGDVLELVDDARRAGLPIELNWSGAAPTDTTLSLTVYRIVQEALTNIMRHARGVAHVSVIVRATAESIELTVDDDGPAQPDRTSDGHERGILGMRERVALYGGTLVAGALTPRGWRVHAVIPVPPTTTTPEAP